MTMISTTHPLQYIAEALTQMATTLRDFEMLESAQGEDPQASGAVGGAGFAGEYCGEGRGAGDGRVFD